MKRIMRLALVLLPALAMFATTTTPANALDAGAVVFAGEATTGTGFAGPCPQPTTPPPVPPDLTKCPPPVGGGNPGVGLSFVGDGVGYIGYFAKPKCTGLCDEAGVVHIVASGSITGFCGGASGTLTGTVTTSVDVGLKVAKTHSFTVTFTALGATVVLTGSITAPKPETVVGAAVSAFDVRADTTICTTKDAHSFLIAGAVAIVNPNIP